MIVELLSLYRQVHFKGVLDHDLKYDYLYSPRRESTLEWKRTVETNRSIEIQFIFEFRCSGSFPGLS
jgi:hypothetical protein